MMDSKQPRLVDRFVANAAEERLDGSLKGRGDHAVATVKRADELASAADPLGADGEAVDGSRDEVSPVPH